MFSRTALASRRLSTTLVSISPRFAPETQPCWRCATQLHTPTWRLFSAGTIAKARDDNGGTVSVEEAVAPDAPTTKRKAPHRTTGAKKQLRDSFRHVVSKAQQPARGATTPTASARTADQVMAEEDLNDASTTISAICVADSFDMDKALAILETHGFPIDPDNTGFETSEVIHARGDGKGDIFVFPSGIVVTWSLPPEAGARLATKHLLSAAGEPHLERTEAEDLDFAQDPRHETSSMKGDLVVLGTRKEEEDGDRLDTTLAKIAFSTGLARSTKLAVLESSLVSYFESTRDIPSSLAKGKFSSLWTRKYILRKTGELLHLRAQLNHVSELTDSLPDLFWDQKPELRLEHYYNQVGKALDINDRIRTLNQKMDYASEIAAVLRETSKDTHSTRLEWIIIWLIAVEVAFELRRVYMEKMDPDRVIGKH